MPGLDDKAQEAVDSIRRYTDEAPAIGVVLGSGLGPVGSKAQNPETIPYFTITGFPVPTVEGHTGNLVVGSLGGVPAAIMQGRFHHYEGYHMRDISLQVRVLAGLGARTLIVTNASGGIRPDLQPGDIMAVTDHINLMGTNPLVGIEEPKGPERGDRFVDMSLAYDPWLIGTASEAAEELGFTLKTGVLAAVTGPCYETPAEVRMIGALGADAVCMSTVPEVITARYLGLRVLGLSLVTNRAAGLSASGPSHVEVLETADKFRERFAGLVESVVTRLG